jgi:methyl-accepting chemotaxis protein
MGIRFRTVVLAACGATLALGLAIVGAGYVVSEGLKSSLRQSETLMSSMREHMTADMLHDGLRGVVFHAAYAGAIGDQAMAKEAADEIEEYGGEFRAAIADQ